MTKNGWANANLRTQLLRLLKRADIKPWPRLFHNLRAWRETELVAKFPIHVLAHWLGNTPEIAMRHYLRVTEEDFAKAAVGKATTRPEPSPSIQSTPAEIAATKEENAGAKSGATLVQNQAQHTLAGLGTASQESTQVVIEKGDMQSVAISCNSLHTPPSGGEGT
jgi:hypothetical protein